ncbi:MAG: hypothetical protein QNJ87_16435 [Gammaproteobacteria bacterium]|nr:hypothetical protein [Gammaproteobacteria bacterium]MDJ0873341.1 hypothetical protein [Gammaproteobacteria bacterium]MDJ0890093.1 hypothetical protein [Gammaproteobacteria bacterium]
MRWRFSRVLVASPPNKPEQVIGYYSLSAGSRDATDLADEFRRRLPKFPVPAVLRGRPAVARPRQGEGLGSIPLADALKRMAQARQVMAVYAVVVDALNERVAEFDEPFGLRSLPSQPLEFFPLMDSVITLIDLGSFISPRERRPPIVPAFGATQTSPLQQPRGPARALMRHGPILPAGSDMVLVLYDTHKRRCRRRSRAIVLRRYHLAIEGGAVHSALQTLANERFGLDEAQKLPSAFRIGDLDDMRTYRNS